MTKDFTTGISEKMYLDQLQVKENMIKAYQEENTKLKELLKRARDLIEQISWCESFYAYNDDLDEEIDEVLK